MYNIRKARASDIADIVKIHQISFPEAFLTLLGKSGLSSYYTFFLQHPYGMLFVCETQGHVVGFVSGWEKGATYQQPLVQKYGHVFALALAKACVLHPKYSWSLIKPRINVLKHYLRQWLKKRGSTEQHRTSDVTQTTAPVIMRHEPGNASLLSIGVLPAHRGRSVAQMLNDAFIRECHERGVLEVLLTVHADNGRARAFYEKQGWQVLKENNESVCYNQILTTAKL
jgi:ribosomal protein S18 acetylase RimI-like enzyme